MKYILSLDQGTTSSRAILFNERMEPVSVAQREFAQHYPADGWVEHDPEEIWTSQFTALEQAVEKSGVDLSDIASIGITCQRETTIVWERESGRPVYNAIVWQCRRTAPYVEELKKRGLSEMITQKTGLLPDAYFSATKIRWILENVDGAIERAKRGELLFGTVDSYLIWKLTNGKVHATDRTNASRTMLFNINTLDWDDELLKLFDIPRCMLPEIKCSGDDFGSANINGTEIPINAAVGDQQSALFGQRCFRAGMAKNTYGTGCFMLMNTGSEIKRSQNGLLTSVAADVRGNNVQYVLEGSVFVGGAVIQWLRDELRIISDSADTEYFASKVKDNGGVYLVPAFTGLGAPYWDMYARGAIVGITRGTKREHIIRAAEESIAYQCAQLLEAMQKDSGIKTDSLFVDGGASRDAFLMQFQADIMDIKLIRPQNHESTAIGAAFLAGLYCGIFKDKSMLETLCGGSMEFSPKMQQSERERLLNGWKKAVSRSLSWADM